MEKKRTAKIIKKKNLSRWIKPASKEDNVDFIIMEYPKCLNHSVLLKTKDYMEILKRGEVPPMELTHYVTIHNKRDKHAIANSLVTNNSCLFCTKNSQGNIPIEIIISILSILSIFIIKKF